jgi:hypothetical protein
LNVQKSLYTNKQELSIFDLKTFDLVKQVSVLTNEMRLVSTSYLILFLSDGDTRFVFILSQSGNFEVLHRYDWYLLNDSKLRLHYANNDASSTISYFD